MKNWKGQEAKLESEIFDFCGEVPGDVNDQDVTMGASSCNWIQQKKMTSSRD